MTKDEALRMALEALERGETELRWQAITAIKEALAKPEQEPVAWYYKEGLGRGVSLKQETFKWIPLYTTPPQRTWVGLTDEETAELVHRYAFYELTRQIEAKLKEKNT